MEQGSNEPDQPGSRRAASQAEPAVAAETVGGALVFVDGEGEFTKGEAAIHRFLAALDRLDRDLRQQDVRRADGELRSGAKIAPDGIVGADSQKAGVHR